MLYYMSTSSKNLRQRSCIKFVSKQKSKPEKHQKVPTTNSNRVDVAKTSNDERARAKWPLDSDRRCRRLSIAICILQNFGAQNTPRVCDRSVCASGRTAAAAPCSTASNRLNASCAHKRARAYKRQQRSNTSEKTMLVNKIARWFVSRLQIVCLLRVRLFVRLLSYKSETTNSERHSICTCRSPAKKTESHILSSADFKNGLECATKIID